MESTFYEIDPSGDTLLILHNANAPFAVFPPATPQAKQNELQLAPDDEPVGERQDADSESRNTGGKQEDAGSEPEDAESEPEDAKSKPTIRMRLSSKHLTLASAYFQKLTANNWKETTPEDGYSYVINAHDWDEKALLTLMNIIHGRTAKVPRLVKLEMLAKIAVLVDYYQCHEAVEFFAQTWLGFIAVPNEGQRDFMLRLAVSIVFKESFNFLVLTGTIIQESNGPIDSLGLPIRQDIIDALNEKREDAISSIMDGIRDLRKRLGGDPKGCTFECTAINLGALLKAMAKMRLIDPFPTPPYIGLKVSALDQGLRNIKEPSWVTNCLGLSPSKDASTKAAPAQASGLFAATQSASRTPSTQADTTPAPAAGLFDLNAAPRSDTPTAGFSFGTPAVPRAKNPFPVIKPVSLKSPNPACTLSEITKPIINELFGKSGGIRLTDYVKP